MSIAKQLIILCMLLYNNAGFNTLNLSNIQYDIRNEVHIQQSNQKSLSTIQQIKKQIPSQSNSNLITQTNLETEDLINTQNNQNLQIQQGQSQNVGQSQTLISEDYQVINITNSQELKIQPQEESQNQSQSNTNSQIITNKDNSNNNRQDDNNLQQIIQNEQVEFDDEAGYINDSPLDFDLSEDSNKSQNKQEDQSNYEQSLLKSMNSKDDIGQDDLQLQKSNEIQKSDQDKNELALNKNEDLINKQNIEETFNQDQIMKNSLNDSNELQKQESNINDQSEIPTPYKMKEVQDDNTQDSLKVGYIIENNVETDDYLKDIEENENYNQKQEDLKLKLEQEQEYLKQLKNNQLDDENKLKQLKEQEKIIYDQEQNELQQIKQINGQLEIQEQELQQIESDYSNQSKNINIQSETNEQTQFRPYEGQELIISSEVNYDEGNIEQFEQSQNNSVIEEKAEVQELENNQQVEQNWNQSTQYQETFEQNDYIINSEKESNGVQNYDQSIPAQLQEISIDLNLKSNDLTTQINLSKDVLITANNEQVESSNFDQSLEDPLKQNNQNLKENNTHLENQQENAITNFESHKKEIQELNQNLQDQDNQILNFEDYNQQSNESESQQILSNNSEISLTQNNDSQFANKDQNIQPDNILTYQQQNNNKQIKQFQKDLSYYQIQQLIKRTLNLRGSIQDMLVVQQPSLLFQNNERQHYDQNNENTNNQSWINLNMPKFTEILNLKNEMTMNNMQFQNEKEQIMVSLEGRDIPNSINLLEEQHIKN
ncbi:unnamed protein product [Paramecium pentaurelia]|uniref:Transmembrane protein n=1 Tax=Paramecium pentaurelia TaxID=43138 RepID=A0A8S1U821_9CILI|nr:unnamed protein product [Paramecium pentaurelia]